MLKDIIRTELAPLRSDVASLEAEVDRLSAQVQNIYPRELMDEKFHQRDRGCHGAGKDRARH